MTKKFTKMQTAAIKRTAQNVARFIANRDKLNAKIEEIRNNADAEFNSKLEELRNKFNEKIEKRVEKFENEKNGLISIIDSFQTPIKAMTGGYTTEDLVNKEVINTGKIDTNTGKEILQTRYVLKYPETVVPPTDVDGEEEPSEIASEDSEEATEALVEGQAEALEEAENEGFEPTESEWD